MGRLSKKAVNQQDAPEATRVTSTLKAAKAQKSTTNGTGDNLQPSHSPANQDPVLNLAVAKVNTKRSANLGASSGPTSSKRSSNPGNDTARGLSSPALFGTRDTSLPGTAKLPAGLRDVLNSPLPNLHSPKNTLASPIPPLFHQSPKRPPFMSPGNQFSLGNFGDVFPSPAFSPRNELLSMFETPSSKAHLFTPTPKKDLSTVQANAAKTAAAVADGNCNADASGPPCNHSLLDILEGLTGSAVGTDTSKASDKDFFQPRYNPEAEELDKLVSSVLVSPGGKGQEDGQQAPRLKARRPLNFSNLEGLPQVPTDSKQFVDNDQALQLLCQIATDPNLPALSAFSGPNSSLALPPEFLNLPVSGPTLSASLPANIDIKSEPIAPLNIPQLPGIPPLENAPPGLPSLLAQILQPSLTPASAPATSAAPGTAVVTTAVKANAIQAAATTGPPQATPATAVIRPQALHHSLRQGAVLQGINATPQGQPHNTQVPPESGPKTCHCKKSQCLKLYCDCFAAGMYCSNCSCLQCMNKPEHAKDVMQRRESIISRDPEAFTGKIAATQKSHRKGCNCKKSHCLKKYCECFQGGVKCNDSCKCVDCQNQDESKPQPAGGSQSDNKITWHVPPSALQPTPASKPGTSKPTPELPALATAKLPIATLAGLGLSSPPSSLPSSVLLAATPQSMATSRPPQPSLTIALPSSTPAPALRPSAPQGGAGFRPINETPGSTKLIMTGPPHSLLTPPSLVAFYTNSANGAKVLLHSTPTPAGTTGSQDGVAPMPIDTPLTSSAPNAPAASAAMLPPPTGGSQGLQSTGSALLSFPSLSAAGIPPVSTAPVPSSQAFAAPQAGYQILVTDPSGEVKSVWMCPPPPVTLEPPLDQPDAESLQPPVVPPIKTEPGLQESESQPISQPVTLNNQSSNPRPEHDTQQQQQPQPGTSVNFSQPLVSNIYPPIPAFRGSHASRLSESMQASQGEQGQAASNAPVLGRPSLPPLDSLRQPQQQQEGAQPMEVSEMHGQPACAVDSPDARTRATPSRRLLGSGIHQLVSPVRVLGSAGKRATPNKRKAGQEVEDTHMVDAEHRATGTPTKQRLCAPGLASRPSQEVRCAAEPYADEGQQARLLCNADFNAINQRMSASSMRNSSDPMNLGSPPNCDLNTLLMSPASLHGLTPSIAHRHTSSSPLNPLHGRPSAPAASQLAGVQSSAAQQHQGSSGTQLNSAPTAQNAQVGPAGGLHSHSSMPSPGLASGPSSASKTILITNSAPCQRGAVMRHLQPGTITVMPSPQTDKRLKA